MTLTVLLTYVYFYDLRGGGVETEIKEDKQGLNTLKRNKKRFPAQQMVTQLEALAHNTLAWARRWLRAHCRSTTIRRAFLIVIDVRSVLLKQTKGLGIGGKVSNFDNLMFDVGCNPQSPVNRENSTPTVATDYQSVKRGEMQVNPEPNWVTLASR
jgi:hypothetical protein